MEGNKVKETQALFSIKNLFVSYGDAPVLRGVSMDIPKGQILGVVGESGSGKSTAIYAALGILGRQGMITAGEVIYKDQTLSSLAPKELCKLRGKELALIAQNPVASFHPIRKVKRQLADLVKSHGGISYQEAEERMLEMLSHMKLKNGRRLLDSYAFEMSGGMCQRVSIAMGMVLRPGLLFADEPTSALDVTVQAQVVEELMQIREQYQTTILIVSHNIGVIAHMSDQVVVMYAGMVLEKGTPIELLRNPLHPYTKNLILAIPKLNAPAPMGVKICRPDRKAAGCPYVDACPRCSSLCREEVPGLHFVEGMHQVRCHQISGEVAV